MKKNSVTDSFPNDIMEITGLKKLVGNLLIVILALYVFRDCLNSAGLGTVVYLLTGVSFLLCLFIPKQRVRVSRSVLVYVSLGVFFVLLSYAILIDHQMIVGTLGFVAVYANMIVWLLFLIKLGPDEASSYFKKLVLALVSLGVITALLGVYQTFADRSIWGLATNSLYASEEAMESGRFVPRATALLGSAQNYGLFVGMSFCACLFFDRGRPFFRFAGIAILLMGIVVSGSRSASICAIVAVVLFLYRFLAKNRIPRGSLVILSLSIVAVLLGFVVFGISDVFENRTTQRLLDFGMSETFSVYSKVFENLQGISLFLGNGLGYGSWTVAQIVGGNIYAEAFNVSYSSTESYFLQTWLQCGLPGLLSLLVVELIAIKNAWSMKDIGAVALLVCILVNQVFTPSFTSLAISFSSWPIILSVLIDWPACKGSVARTKRTLFSQDAREQLPSKSS